MATGDRRAGPVLGEVLRRRYTPLRMTNLLGARFWCHPASCILHRRAAPSASHNPHPTIHIPHPTSHLLLPSSAPHGGRGTRGPALLGVGFGPLGAHLPRDGVSLVHRLLVLAVRWQRRGIRLFRADGIRRWPQMQDQQVTNGDGGHEHQDTQSDHRVITGADGAPVALRSADRSTAFQRAKMPRRSDFQ